MLHMTYPRTSRNLQSLPFAVTVEATAAKGVLPPGQHPQTAYGLVRGSIPGIDDRTGPENLEVERRKKHAQK